MTEPTPVTKNEQVRHPLLRIHNITRLPAQDIQSRIGSITYFPYIVLPYDRAPVDLRNGIMYHRVTSDSNRIFLLGRSHTTEFVERKTKI